MYKNAEDFLREKHSQQYNGTDDNMSDDFETWLSNLDGEEWMEFINELLTN